MQDVQSIQEWDNVQPQPDRQYGDAQGAYVSDMPDGEEHQHWPDGSEYYGEWRDGQPNGRGIYVSASGQSCCVSAYINHASFQCGIYVSILGQS